jgi:hypothetical protein
VAQYLPAVFYSGLGRYADALSVALDSDHPGVESSTVGNTNLVELSRQRREVVTPSIAGAAMLRVTAMSEASCWALGNLAWSQALMRSQGRAESPYQDAIDSLC